MIKQAVFRDFSEWWYYARSLNEAQRKLVFDQLPHEQQHVITDSYKRDGWDDVLHRNEIDNILDDLKEKYGYDVLDLRAKILRGKSVYLPAKFWELVTAYLRRYKSEDVNFAISSIRATPCRANPNVVLLTTEDAYTDKYE